MYVTFNEGVFFFIWPDGSWILFSIIFLLYKEVHASILVPYFLAHRIRISEILPQDRKSYLTPAILPRLSCEGYIHWLHIVVKWRHCYDKVTSSCEIVSWRIQELPEAYFKIKQQWLARKIIHYSCEGRIEKSVPRNHRLSSHRKPRDAKRRSSGPICLSYHQTHDGFL